MIFKNTTYIYLSPEYLATLQFILVGLGGGVDILCILIGTVSQVSQTPTTSPY